MSDDGDRTETSVCVSRMRSDGAEQRRVARNSDQPQLSA